MAATLFLNMIESGVAAVVGIEGIGLIAAPGRLQLESGLLLKKFDNFY